MEKTVKTDMLKVRITPELKAEIQAAAESENRTVSGYVINLIMQDILSYYITQHRKIKKKLGQSIFLLDNMDRLR